MQIQLKYGRQDLTFEHDPERFTVLSPYDSKVPLTDVEIGRRLDDPIGSEILEDLVRPGESVLFVVPDITRQVGCGQVVNLMVRRLIANGTAAHDIRIIFATGIHRKVTEGEKAEILTPFIAQRIKTLDHDPRDLAQLVNLGVIGDAVPIELNRALVEHDHVVLIGGVTFHYFAGFTGGRKLICPGLASTRTVSATHRLAFDCQTLSRRSGVGPGQLDGNAVHEAFVGGASVVKPSFAVNTVVNDAGEITDLFCGDWLLSHRAACDAYGETHTVFIEEKRDLVIASGGGHPYDVNLIQAHKTLEAASHACSDGGMIILLAACPDGLGRSDFMKWFEASNSTALAKMLCEKYQVNGQTAWSLLSKTERFDVRVMTGLPEDKLTHMRARSIDAASVDEIIRQSKGGYIIPAGSKIQIKPNR